MYSLDMSSDMRPSARLWSSVAARRSAAPGDCWRGAVGAAGDLFTLSRFSNWARREDTGLMDEPSVLSWGEGSMDMRWQNSLAAKKLSRLLKVCTAASAGARRCPAIVHRPPSRRSH